VQARVMVALVALGLLSGCGASASTSSTSSSPSQTSSSASTTSSPASASANFNQRFSSAANQLGKTSQAIGADIEAARSKTDAQLAATFRALANRWQSHVSQLETLKPPANVAVDFNSMTAAASRAEADLSAIAVAAETHSASAAKQASASLVTDITSAKAAGAVIANRLGIK
jgi:hypothetical protein